MPDNLSPEDRRKTMRAVKGSNTSLERAVEAAFLERGWACQRHVADLPGKPDFVFVERPAGGVRGRRFLARLALPAVVRRN